MKWTKKIANPSLLNYKSIDSSNINSIRIELSFNVLNLNEKFINLNILCYSKRAIHKNLFQNLLKENSNDIQFSNSNHLFNILNIIANRKYTKDSLEIKSIKKKISTKRNPNSLKKVENLSKLKQNTKDKFIPLKTNSFKTKILGLENLLSQEFKNKIVQSIKSQEIKSIEQNNKSKIIVDGNVLNDNSNSNESIERKFIEETFFAPKNNTNDNTFLNIESKNNVISRSTRIPLRNSNNSFSQSRLSLLSYARLVDMTDFIQKHKTNSNDLISNKLVTKNIPINEFKNVLFPGIMEYLKVNNIDSFTDIQAKSLLNTLKSKKLKKNHQSVLLASQTGTGKTLAYLLPILNNIKFDEIEDGIGIQAYRPRALILVPSKQLASQVCRVAKSISHQAKFRTALFRSDFKTRRMRVDAEDADVIVSTPGIWMHMLEKGYTHYTDLKYIVVDEADSMLDEKSFGKEVKDILKDIIKKCDNPQFFFAMATVNHSILDWTSEFSPNAKILVSESIHRHVPSVTQTFIDCSQIDKLKDCLLPILKKETEPTIVFCNTVDSARAVNLFLMENNIYTANFHAEIRPKEQHEEFEKFRKGSVNVLVTTDIASRGLDITFVKHIINFDFPKNHVDYIHRIGRTGRMGASGKVTSLLRKKDKGLAESIKRAVLEERRLDSIKNRFVQKKIELMKKKNINFKKSSVIAKKIIQKTNTPPEPW